MTRYIAAAFAAWALLCTAVAAQPASCVVPDSLLLSDSLLKRVSEAVANRRSLAIAVVGTGSSAIAGPDGPRSAYPTRLQAALGKRLAGVTVKVVTLLRSRQTSEDLARGMSQVLVDERPDLVIWQTGTFDAIRRVDPDLFKTALDEGIDRIHQGGADVVLMNMQYSPRTESMIAVGPYVDVMRLVAQQHEIPLFDRLGIMRYWSETGVFDLYAAVRDNALAKRVHDCIGQAIATVIIDAGRLRAFEARVGQ